MAPLARVSHALPGRIRVRIEEKRGDEAYFSNLKQALAEFPDVLDVETNRLTGSVLVHHNANSRPVWRLAAEKGLFHVDENDPHLRAVAPMVAEEAAPNREAPARKLSLAAWNSPVWRRVLFLGLLAVGVAQIVEGNIKIPALTAFWYAYMLYMMPEAVNAPNVEAESTE